MKRYKIAGEWISKGETVSVDEVEMVLASDHESALAELRRECGRLKEALKKHGKHYIACASEWPDSNGGSQKCDCGLSEALGAPS